MWKRHLWPAVLTFWLVAPWVFLLWLGAVIAWRRWSGVPLVVSLALSTAVAFSGWCAVRRWGERQHDLAGARLLEAVPDPESWAWRVHPAQALKAAHLSRCHRRWGVNARSSGWVLKGQPHPAIYGKLAAEWQVDHWQFSVEDAVLPQDNGGKFRSEFSDPILIQGEAATNDYLARIKAALALAKPRKDVIERLYQEDLRQASQPGTLYTGQINRRDNKSIPVELRFTAPPGNDPGLARFELKLPASGYIYTCSAKLARRVPNMPTESTDTDNPFTKLVEPASEGDLAINYEHVNSPKFNLADDLANDLLYNHSGVRDAPLELRDHQITGKLTNLPHNFLTLSVRQNP